MASRGAGGLGLGMGEVTADGEWSRSEETGPFPGAETWWEVKGWDVRIGIYFGDVD